ncbi:MAG: YigZ family protein [Bacteroidaceae bacterium]|jgi:uncharacterized YigZ family protein|nr:YigZ family protein [Bacteroidaceae bacterium]
MLETDEYMTIGEGGRAEFTEQRSRFISYSYHVTDTEQVKDIVAAMRKEYYNARHVCYAYMIGFDRSLWRANDDGEPSGTAGKPILGQINSAGLTDVLIISVRYFGGVKLGTSGLIEAYRRSAAMAIEASRIEVRHIEQTLVLLFRYSMMNDVMRTIKDFGLTVLEQQYGFFQTDRVESARDEKFECLMKLTVRQKDLETVCDRLDKFIEIQQSIELVYYAE